MEAISFKGAVYGIDGSIDRLQRLAIRIRQSSKDGLPERVRAFAKKLPPNDSENIVSEIIEFKYPKANKDLVAHLTKSIIYRRQRLMYARRHQGKLAQERDMHTEPHLAAAEASQLNGARQPRSGIADSRSQKTKPLSSEIYSETDPSIMNTEVYIQQDNVKQTKSSNVARSDSSSWIGEIVYPPPPTIEDGANYAVCPLCLEELSASDRGTVTWRYDETKPYI